MWQCWSRCGLVGNFKFYIEWIEREWAACLVPDFSGIALSFSPFNLMLAIGLLYIAFIMFQDVPCVSDLFKT